MRPMVIEYGYEIEVNTDLALEMWDNGKSADEKCALLVAPVAGGKIAGVKPGGACWYIETNGDPLLIAYETDDGVDLHPEAARRLYYCGITPAPDESVHPTAAMLTEAIYEAADADNNA